jgi:hypothetical protein
LRLKLTSLYQLKKNDILIHKNPNLLTLIAALL